MLSRVQSYLLTGIDAHPCEIEVDHDAGAVSTDSGEARVLVVGLPDAGVKESIQRVQSAMGSAGLPMPVGRVLINLAPADTRKEGPLYDLPIAVGVLIAQGVLRPDSPPARTTSTSTGTRAASSPSPRPGPAPLSFTPPSPQDYLIAGELALDGRLRPIKGVLAMASLAKARGYRGVIVPSANAAEAAAVRGIDVLGAATLQEVVGWFMGSLEPAPHPPLDIEAQLATASASVDFADVRGQEAVKRAIVIACAGDHNLLMLGPAGTGKTMMARALPGVLPPLTPEEAIEITRIYSAAGLLTPGQGLITVRPVRTPHHTASPAAIVGGGAVPRPGEISLAHRGVLFLDELPEFPRDVLETLRQPLEDHVVTIARSHSAVRFPASFMLVAAMNPTPKGDMPTGEVGKRAMDRYLAKLSGPLIDRIDLHVEAPAVSWKELSAPPAPPSPRTTGDAGHRAPGTRDQSSPLGPRPPHTSALGPPPAPTSSHQMREKVREARDRQHHRQRSRTPPGASPIPNSRLSGRDLDTLAPLTPGARSLLGQAMTELGLSARAYDKIRRVARTIADLEGQDTLDEAAIAEAVSYRLLDRKL